MYNIESYHYRGVSAIRGFTVRDKIFTNTVICFVESLLKSNNFKFSCSNRVNVCLAKNECQIPDMEYLIFEIFW